MTAPEASGSPQEGRKACPEELDPYTRQQLIIRRNERARKEQHKLEGFGDPE